MIACRSAASKRPMLSFASAVMGPATEPRCAHDRHFSGGRSLEQQPYCYGDPRRCSTVCLSLASYNTVVARDRHSPTVDKSRIKFPPLDTTTPFPTFVISTPLSSKPTPCWKKGIFLRASYTITIFYAVRPSIIFFKHPHAELPHRRVGRPSPFL